MNTASRSNPICLRLLAAEGACYLPEPCS